jgi:small subunit ribosomal protein S4
MIRVQGGKRMGKITEYGKQLREKQKAKRMFGLSEKQFQKYYDRAARSQTVTGDKLLELLERRLDSVLYRAGLALTRNQGRQFASHGMLLVNGRRIDIPSYEVRIGDKVEVRDAKKSSVVFTKNQEEFGEYIAPSWLKVDLKKLSLEVVDIPTAQHFEQIIEPQLIVEFYSR